MDFEWSLIINHKTYYLLIKAMYTWHPAIEHDHSIDPICSMVLEHLLHFPPQMTQWCRLILPSIQILGMIYRAKYAVFFFRYIKLPEGRWMWLTSKPRTELVAITWCIFSKMWQKLIWSWWMIVITYDKHIVYIYICQFSVGKLLDEW